MTKRRKMYANGTGAKGYLESPYETMADYDIMLAKAEQQANNNSGSAITMMAGNLLGTALSSLGGAAAPAGGDIGAPPLPDITAPPAMAANGKTSAKGGIEVEGGEILDPPGSNPIEVQGPKHEQGGVDANVPAGTRIFSDRIVKNGKTMAERKATRERKLKNLGSTLETQSDIATLNAAKRMQQGIEQEEMEDLKLQEIADSFAEMTGQYAYGTSSTGTPPYTTTKTKGQLDLTDPNYMGYLLPDVPLPDGWDAAPDTTGLIPQQPEGIEINNLAEDNGPSDVPQNFSVDKPGTVVSRTLDTLGKKNLPIPTAGDITGLIGNAISTFGPMKNTLANRAGDTPNINAFKDFGKDALDANSDAMDFAASQRDNSRRRVGDNARTSKRAARNSARGVNTMRALDLGIDENVNDANLNIDTNFANQLMQLFSNKSQLENVQDQMVMTGEQERDLNNRKDRDNFFTQKGKDIVSMGTGVQQTGKDINDILKNPVYLNLLNQMGKYFTVNSKGELEAKTT